MRDSTRTWPSTLRAEIAAFDQAANAALLAAADAATQSEVWTLKLDVKFALDLCENDDERAYLLRFATAILIRPWLPKAA